MRNIKVVIEYDGTQYQGFQYQPGVPTIQGELEKVLSILVKEPVTIYGAGRTDTGVHALGQVINFRSNCTIPIEKVCVAMNSRLPIDISAARADEMDMSFHSRYSAKRRVYRYHILNTNLRSAITCRFAWHVGRPLNDSLMSDAAQALLGVNDYLGLCRGIQETQTTVRLVDRVEVSRIGDNVTVEVSASGFLRSMMRVIVGVLVDIGLKKLPVETIEEIVRNPIKGATSATAPPNGLCLLRVDY